MSPLREETDEFEKTLLEKAPAWLISLIVHLIVLLVLALIPLRRLVEGPITLFLGAPIAGDVAEFELTYTGGEAAQLTPASDAADFDVGLEPADMELDLSELLAVREPSLASTSIDIPAGILKGLSGRRGAMKQALLDRFGGTKETEDAVELGLQWLAKYQRSDGGWSLRGPYRDGGVKENYTAATAMALLAFLGAGHTPKEGKYKDVVRLGLEFLIRRQNSEGFFSKQEPSRQQMYAHALATIAVAEAYGLTRDNRYRGPAQRAIEFAQWAQSSTGGWRYTPREDSDLSVTGWFVMALQTGRMAGLHVDEEKLAEVSKFLNSVSSDEYSRYSYTEFEPPSLSMTAEGLLCRMYLGWPRTHPALVRAITEDLLPARPSKNDEQFSVYYWYYATQVLHHFGGRAWQQWNEAMKATIPAMQEKSGREAGSWDPNRDVFGASGGRLYTTCLHIYCLEVYYRHLAIYDVPE